MKYRCVMESSGLIEFNKIFESNGTRAMVSNCKTCSCFQIDRQLHESHS